VLFECTHGPSAQNPNAARPLLTMPAIGRSSWRAFPDGRACGSCGRGGQVLDFIDAPDVIATGIQRQRAGLPRMIITPAVIGGARRPLPPLPRAPRQLLRLPDTRLLLN